MPQTQLELVAIAARAQLITRNVYNSTDAGNNYSVTHTRAMSDDITPINGKGTGVPFDSYNGGSSDDINGVANAVGSGRLANLTTNQYTPQSGYIHPDTSGNVGQVTIS
jgi:hypothetical protein